MKRITGILPFVAGVAFTLVLGWWVFPTVLYTQQEQPLRFSHRTHTGEDVGMGCEDCHQLEADRRLSLVPSVTLCADCHSEPLGESEAERTLVNDYVLPGREIPWLVYSRQPDHVYFSHIVHVRTGELECATCHGGHGTSDDLPTYEQNRITGYSRLIWGHSLSRTGLEPFEGKKMVDCSRCHQENGIVESCMDCHK